MQIRNAIAPVRGISEENTFIAVDEQGNQVGMGQIIYQYQPHLNPDCPVNMYFTLESQPSGKYMLLGALAARARVLRESNPHAAARMYTAIPADDAESIAFFQHNGLECVDTENRMQLKTPEQFVQPFMGLSLMPVPLGTDQDRAAFCARMREYDIPVTPAYLNELQRYQHFNAQGLVYNNALIGEALVSGSGSSCELVGIYIHPDYRRKHYAKNFIEVLMTMMARGGVNEWYARLVSQSAPQKGLARSLRAKNVQVMQVFPAMKM